MSLMCDCAWPAGRPTSRAGFVNVGVTPEFGSSFLLPAIVGLGRALDMVLTARSGAGHGGPGHGPAHRVTPADSFCR